MSHDQPFIRTHPENESAICHALCDSCHEDLALNLSPDDVKPVETLTLCLKDINSWMNQSFLQLNTDKPEMIISPKSKRRPITFQLSSFSLTFKEHARNLGVIFDSVVSIVTV